MSFAFLPFIIFALGTNSGKSLVKVSFEVELYNSFSDAQYGTNSHYNGPCTLRDTGSVFFFLVPIRAKVINLIQKRSPNQ